MAKKLASSLVERGHDDEALHLLTLTAIVKGEYAEARATYRQIGPQYERLAELDEPMLWAHVHQGDMTAAHEFAERRDLLRDSVPEPAGRALPRGRSASVACRPQHRRYRV